MKTETFKVDKSLYLIHQSIEVTVKPKVVETPVNHIIIIDCSGSMSCDLPRIREQLKKKLPKMLRDKDTISVIWFSGRGQFGILLEAEPVATLADLKDVNTAIDRWLRPIGMTGFKEPIEEVPQLVDRLAKKNPGVCSLFFMTDGCDNQWSRDDILKAIEKVSDKISSSTFVEYGYYADRPLLTAMAQKAGGSLIFSEDFDKYAPTFEEVMARKISSAPRIEVKVVNDTIGGFIYALHDGDLITFEVSDGKALVPEDFSDFWYLSSTTASAQIFFLCDISEADAAASSITAPTTAAYAAVSLYSIRMKSNVVFPLLRAIGDVKFIDKFGSCFGKEKYSEFMESAKAAAFGKGQFEQGWDPNKVPKDDAFTVLDLLNILSQDDNNRLLLDHSDFKYSRISRGRVDSSEQLTADELVEMQKLTEQLASERDVKKIKEIQVRIAAITDKKGEALKFEEVKPEPPGYSISGLVFNEDRPNVSVRVIKRGVVDISSRVPSEFKGKVPDKIETSIFRNYAIVRDGLVNVEKLPVRLSDKSISTLNDLIRSGRVPREVIGTDSISANADVVLNLKSLPIINRKMVKDVFAKDLFEKEYALCKARAAQKVYNAYKKEHFAKKSEDGFVVLYGAEVSSWLKEQGITDGGFNPKTVQAESTDVYMGKELKVSLKGLSSLPSLKDVKERMLRASSLAEQLSGGAALMATTVKEVEDFLASGIYQKAADQKKLFNGWLDGQSAAATEQVRRLLFELAQIKFSVIVGQIWFSDFKTIDDTEMAINVDGQSIACKVEQKEIQVHI